MLTSKQNSTQRPPGKKRLPRPRANAVTVHDVAKVAGVSVATVSRVLNANSAVAKVLRERVTAAAARLGYTPHAAARALASQRSRTIGAVIPTLENANFAAGIEALQRRLADAGYTLLLASSNYDAQEELRQVKALAAHGVAGMLLVGASHASGLYEFLEARKIPSVNAWVLDAKHASVGFDNREIGRALARYLLDLGHLEFGLIAQITSNSDRAAARVAGVRETLAARGLRPPLERLTEYPYKIIEGQLALRGLMQARPRPTAVICGTDNLAFGALTEAQRLGLAVPRELSIAGINDAEFSAYLNPPLTTMRLPAAEIGARAAEYLLGMVDERPVAPVTEVQVSLIVRGSTGPPSQRVGQGK
jgi:LacI family transcriptional regulator